MISLLITLIVVLIVAAGVLGVVAAILALPAFERVRPYANVVYALCVLLVILIAVSYLGYDLPVRR